MKKILLSLFTVGVSGSILFAGTNAFFSDTETSSGNSFVAGAFDLLVNDENDPEAVVNITDLKPGDDYFIDKKLTIQNPGYVWLHLKDYVSGQGTQTEPEDVEEAQDGEKWDLENYLTYDLSFKDGETLIPFDSEVKFPDVFSCWIPLGEIPAGDTTLVQSFHFDSSVTNWAQGDELTFNEEFYAEQVRNNQNPAGPPSTGSGRTWNPETKSCEDCETGKVWTTSVIAYSQGTLKNNNPITDPNRTDPNKALGPADWISGTGTNFYSLGKNGTITLKFNTLVLDKPGDDLSFHEATNGRPGYPLESALVEVSQNGATWQSLGNVGSEPGGDGVEYKDISSTGWPSVSYVRLTDNTNFTPHASNADGYDLDAVDGVNGCLVQ